MIGLSVNYGSVRGPAGNLRLYDLLKEQNQLAGHLMTGANIRSAVWGRHFPSTNTEITITELTNNKQ